MNQQSMQVGGQAVIEGVMMRSPEAYAVAVRLPDGRILVRRRPFTSWVKRFKILSLPILRGAVVLVESLTIGVKTLGFSGDAAVADQPAKSGNGTEPSTVGQETKGWLSQLWLGLTVLVSLGLGLLIFFYVPLLLTELTGAESGFLFNLMDGVFRLGIFLLYLFLITMLKDIRRVFEYHGAEHKSIYAYEKKQPLTVTHALKMSRFHPRCGTSFLLIVMLVSVLVFMFLGRPEDVADRLFRLAFVPLIGGLSYELIRLSDKRAGSRFWRPLILPGLWLQSLTTREPDAGQVEVALVALRTALGENLAGMPNVVLEADPRVAVDLAG